MAHRRDVFGRVLCAHCYDSRRDGLHPEVLARYSYPAKERGYYYAVCLKHARSYYDRKTRQRRLALIARDRQRVRGAPEGRRSPARTASANGRSTSPPRRNMQLSRQ